MPESQSGANRPIVDARLEKLTDDDDIDGTKPNESEFELNIDELGPGTLQCPVTRKVKPQTSEGTIEPASMTKLSSRVTRSGKITCVRRTMKTMVDNHSSEDLKVRSADQGFFDD